MHTDATLDILRHVTRSLGNSLREFEEKTCSLFTTRELERERAARQRRQEKTKVSNEARPMTITAATNNARRPKHLNLNTYKIHSLGDYVSTIEQYGTTDSYSTQPVSAQLTGNFHGTTDCLYLQLELEHRTSKARFPRTSGRLVPLNLSKIERRERHIRRIREKIWHSTPQVATEHEDIVHNPRAQYNIGKSQNSPVNISIFLQKNDGDPATKVSIFLLPSCTHP
jgi:hypothetical protein